MRNELGHILEEGEMKRNIWGHLIRAILSCALIYGAYRESGICTAAAIFLLWIAIEAHTISINSITRGRLK